MAKEAPIYVKTARRFYDDPSLRAGSLDAWFLMGYLMGCIHGNMIGCYRLPLAYIAADVPQMGTRRIRAALDELIAGGEGPIAYDFESQTVLVKNFLKYNQIENPNQEIAAIKKLEELHESPAIFALFAGVIEQFDEGKKAHLKRVLAWLKQRLPEPLPEGFHKPFGKPEAETEAETEEETETETEAEKSRAREAKTEYAEFVTLKPSEHEKLCSDYGEAMTNALIKTLDDYKGAHGKRYRSDYRAILSWVVDKVKKTHTKRSNALDQIGEMIDEPDGNSKTGVHGRGKLAPSAGS